MAVSRDSLPEGLLSDVKNYLNITWDDEATDAKISGLIASGMMYLNSKLGAEADYTLDINYEYVADCSIRMHIRARDGSDFSLAEM